MPNSCVHARPLRIAVLMDVRSPWSVEIAVSLAAMGAEVTVLALRVASSGAGAGGAPCSTKVVSGLIAAA